MLLLFIYKQNIANVFLYINIRIIYKHVNVILK